MPITVHSFELLKMLDRPQEDVGDVHYVGRILLYPKAGIVQIHLLHGGAKQVLKRLREAGIKVGSRIVPEEAEDRLALINHNSSYQPLKVCNKETEISDGEITGILKFWRLHTVVLPEKQLVTFKKESRGLIPRVVIGEVVKDFAGRFCPGVTMRSSLITKFDSEKGTVHTLNSIYKLEGPGLEITGPFPADYSETVGQSILEKKGENEPTIH
ncbi:MAG: hypothetical protein V7739_18900 [Motiliproteus sp.]